MRKIQKKNRGILVVIKAELELYKRSRKEYYLHCQGKNPSTLKATCKYIESRIKRRFNSEQNLHEVWCNSNGIVLRCKEIVHLLKLEEEADWQWL